MKPPPRNSGRPSRIRAWSFAPTAASPPSPDADLEIGGLREADRMIWLGREVALEREARAERLVHGALEQAAIAARGAARGDAGAMRQDVARGRAVELAVRGERARDLRRLARHRRRIDDHEVVLLGRRQRG